MPKWITTGWYTVDYGYNISEESGGWFSNGKTIKFSTPFPGLKERLAQLSRWCDENQYTIKSMTPLTTSVSHTNYKIDKTLNHGAAGYGYGYGISQHTGFVVLLQKEEELSEDEYNRRLALQKLQFSEAELKERIAECEAAVEEDATIVTEIIEKKAMFGGPRFYIGEKEFKSADEARAEQAELYDLITHNKQLLDELRAELIAVQQEQEQLG
jgi:hypothetical protein